MEQKLDKKTYNFLLAVLTLGPIAIILFLLLTPAFFREHVPARKSACMTHMREIGLAYQMYVNDYNGFTPTWCTSKGQKGNVVVKPSAKNFSELRGRIPPVVTAIQATSDVLSTWPMRVYSYKKNSELVWCPSDAEPSTHPNAHVSYVLKPVADSNYWNSGPKMRSPYTDEDFRYPAEQILFYERRSFHWGNAPIWPNAEEGTSFNAVFFDCHVKTVRLVDPQIEPQYYNWDPEADNGYGKPTGKRQIDPRKYCDKLQ